VVDGQHRRPLLLGAVVLLRGGRGRGRRGPAGPGAVARRAARRAAAPEEEEAADDEQDERQAAQAGADQDRRGDAAFLLARALVLFLVVLVAARAGPGLGLDRRAPGARPAGRDGPVGPLGLPARRRRVLVLVVPALGFLHHEAVFALGAIDLAP